jgi:hypothetical protein
LTKKEELTEITEAEFLKYITRTLDTCDDQISVLEATKQQFFRLYRDYQVDKQFSNLKFYVQGTALMYDKQSSDHKIGFKYSIESNRRETDAGRTNSETGKAD